MRGEQWGEAVEYVETKVVRGEICPLNFLNALAL